MQKLESINMEEFRAMEEQVYVDGAFGLQELVGIGITFVVIAIVAGFGVLMLSQMKSKINDTSAQAVLDNGVGAISTLTDYLGLIALAIVIGIVLTVVIVYLYNRFNA